MFKRWLAPLALLTLFSVYALDSHAHSCAEALASLFQAPTPTSTPKPSLFSQVLGLLKTLSTDSLEKRVFRLRIGKTKELRDALDEEALEVLSREMREHGQRQDEIFLRISLGQDTRALKSELEGILKSEPIKKIEAVTHRLLPRDGVYRVTFESGNQALFKVVTEGNRWKTDLSREIAIYHLDLLLGLDLVPVVVERTINVQGDSQAGILMGYVKGHSTTRVDRVAKMKFLDLLISNGDRGDKEANYLITPFGQVAIDHSLAFTPNREAAQIDLEASKRKANDYFPGLEIVEKLRELNRFQLRRRLPELSEHDFNELARRRAYIIELFKQAGLIE